MKLSANDRKDSLPLKHLYRQALEVYEGSCRKNLELRAVLFDMDGVLYDSMPAHERSWLETAETYGLPMSQTDVYMFEGQTGGQTIEILMARKSDRKPKAEEVREIYAHKTKLFNLYNTGAIIPGIADVLDCVSHLKRVLVTGSSQASLLTKLNENFPGVFSPDMMVTGLDVTYGKPHPEPYLRGLALTDLAPHQAVVVENAPSGVRSAVSAGCFTIAVNTGPLDDTLLWQAGAHLVLSDMLSLKRLFEEITSLD